MGLFGRKKDNDEDSMAWNNKGEALKELGRHEEAEQCFAKAKELEDES
jgi:Flp pilus assembly protein TadD